MPGLAGMEWDMGSAYGIWEAVPGMEWDMGYGIYGISSASLEWDHHLLHFGQEPAVLFAETHERDLAQFRVRLARLVLGGTAVTWGVAVTNGVLC